MSMIDQRLYRLAFVPALVAVVVILFSLEPVPDPLDAPVSLGGFDEDAAALTADEVVNTAPDRPPGSPGDAEVADLVAERFGEIGSAELSEQSLSSSFDGEDVELRNVIATLPGESERRLVIIAPRDAAVGAGAASSAAATGVLLDLAQRFGGASHEKTLVFVSTGGATDGAIGAREFADHYPERDLIDAALVISQPGARRLESPFVIPWSAGRQSTAMQLTRTAAEIVSAEVDRPAGLGGAFGDLMRLALPTGLGEQAPLIQDGIDAVAISSAGERPLAPAEDGPDAFSERTLGDFGQAAQTMILALDADPDPLEHGPAVYVTVADSLIPGWAVALLALMLLLPAAVAAADGFARALRRGRARPLDLGWVLGRSLPFLGALALAYLVSIPGLLPRPRFPFDPGRFAIDPAAALVLLLLAAALVAAWIATRPLSVPRRRDPEGLATATGVVSAVAALGLWLLNPYVALLAAPAAHAWLGATATEPRVRAGGSVGAVAVSLVPAIVALVWLAGRLEVGAAVPWHVLLMVAGGLVGPATALLGCVVAGCLTSVLAAGLTSSPPGAEPRISVLGPESRADASSAGGQGHGGRGRGGARPEPRADDGRIFDAQRLTNRAPRAD